jgi:hypothetical protein
MYNRGLCNKWGKRTAGVEPQQTELWGEEKDINLDELLAPKSEEEMQHLVNAFIIKRQIGW